MHVDSDRNLRWVIDNCQIKDQNAKDDVFSVFIIPGDIGSSIIQMMKVFLHLRNHYDLVCYMPGNHEAWTVGSLRKSRSLETTEEVKSPLTTAENSIEKLSEVNHIAKLCGVHTGPVTVSYGSDSSSSSLTLLPLHSWYHSSFDSEPEIQHPGFLENERIFPFKMKWSDFRMCSWPKELISKKDFVENHSQQAILAEYFSQLNEPLLFPKSVSSTDKSHTPSSSPLIQNISQLQLNHSPEENTIISFSHFVPRIELTPEKRFLLEPHLMKVIGSQFLGNQIKQLRPHLHLYGHSHIPMDMTLEQTRYIQWPLGYSRYGYLHFVYCYSSFVYHSTFVVYVEKQKDNVQRFFIPDHYACLIPSTDTV
jgi:hypothetical protein